MEGIRQSEKRRAPLQGGGHLMGLKLYVNDSLTVPVAIRRPWRIRLFSRPWRPLEKFDYAISPDPCLYSMGTGIVGHSETLAVMKERILADGGKGRLDQATVLSRMWWPEGIDGEVTDG